MNLKDSFDASTVKIYIGLTDKKRIDVSAAVIRKHNNANITYKAEKIFIQPLLGTAEVSQLEKSADIIVFAGVQDDPRYCSDKTG